MVGEQTEEKFKREEEEEKRRLKTFLIINVLSFRQPLFVLNLNRLHSVQLIV